jgi:hypothetical protein
MGGYIFWKSEAGQEEEEEEIMQEYWFDLLQFSNNFSNCFVPVNIQSYTSVSDRDGHAGLNKIRGVFLEYCPTSEWPGNCY